MQLGGFAKSTLLLPAFLLPALLRNALRRNALRRNALRRRSALLMHALLLGAVTSCGGGGAQTQDASASCPNDLPPACPSNPPRFTADVQPVVTRRCEPCHAPGGVEPTHPFQTYAQLFSQRATILGQLHGCRMPPADAPQPTAAERQVLLTWLVCGAPND